MSLLARPPAPSNTFLRIFLRTFTSTSAVGAKSSSKKLASIHADLPPYPYPSSAIYKQSNFGLYGLQKIRFGNMVSEKNEIKTRRYWRPNVHSKRLWSGYLQKYVRMRVTTRVLRTIDKCGGLDEYLLGEKVARIKELGMGGWALRWRVLATEGARERIRLQRAALGLPEEEELWWEGLNGLRSSRETQVEEVRRFDEAMDKEDLEVVLDEGEGGIAGADVRFMEEKPAKEERVLL